MFPSCDQGVINSCVTKTNSLSRENFFSLVLSFVKGLYQAQPYNGCHFYWPIKDIRAVKRANLPPLIVRKLMAGLTIPWLPDATDHTLAALVATLESIHSILDNSATYHLTFEPEPPDGRTAEIRLTAEFISACLLYTSPSPRDQRGPRMPSSA